MTFEISLSPQVKELLARGVRITNPCTVEIGEEVPLEAISSQGVEVHGPVRIVGSLTAIGPKVKLGQEGPVTIVNCQIGAAVELGGGYFVSSVFHPFSRLGNGAHVREACLLEEAASGAHCVGLKQTILFPFVTLGSLINFCDCLMAGGTDRKNHSEVGSSFIHFNFTPHQDKATCSLFGDVPHGVMLNKPPIFLGGQGGAVGPLRLGYGTITRAGTILRKDNPTEGLLLGNTSAGREVTPFYPGLYLDLPRRIRNNVVYIANILALYTWYLHVRKLFVRDYWDKAVFEGSLKALENVLKERRHRLEELAGKMSRCIQMAERVLQGKKKEAVIAQATEFEGKWPLMQRVLDQGLAEELGARHRDNFIKVLNGAAKADYISTIKALPPETSRLGTSWLQEVVDGIEERAMDYLPSCR